MENVCASGFIYILHFDDAIGHARHYIGCTGCLQSRLMAHAEGRGARLTAVAEERGIGWTLAALGTVPGAQMRLMERRIKNWHNAAGHCGICNPGTERAIPGTVPYPLSEIKFPLHSKGLLCCTSTTGSLHSGTTEKSGNGSQTSSRKS